jgi:hypothetical protein
VRKFENCSLELKDVEFCGGSIKSDKSSKTILKKLIDFFNMTNQPESI